MTRIAPEARLLASHIDLCQYRFQVNRFQLILYAQSSKTDGILISQNNDSSHMWWTRKTDNQRKQRFYKFPYSRKEAALVDICRNMRLEIVWSFIITNKKFRVWEVKKDGYRKFSKVHHEIEMAIPNSSYLNKKETIKIKQTSERKIPIWLYSSVTGSCVVSNIMLTGERKYQINGYWSVFFSLWSNTHRICNSCPLARSISSWAELLWMS